MAPYPLRYRVAHEKMELSRLKSPSDPFVPQQSRTEYAQRYIYDKAYIDSHLRIIKLLRRLPKDINTDSYYMTVYPGELLALFNGSATVSLVSHKPSIRDVEEYEDWVYVGHSVAMLLIAPKYKDGLFRKLRSLNYAIELAPYRCAFIKGNQITLMSILVHCLEAIRCNAVRIQAYGLKAPINLSEELITFRSPHPHRHTNSFDIGVTERPDITGLALLKGVRPLVVTFPICAPAGKGYGTVRLETKVSQKFIDPFALKDQMIETKMYSKVAHVIKSFGCKYPLFKAKTINVLKRDIIRLSKPLKKSATNLMKTFKVTVPI